MKKRSLRDLPNPSAAHKAITETQKLFRTQCCMAPDQATCSGPIISAHTLSAQAMLRPISRNGHVYTPHFNFFADSLDSVCTIKLTGIRDTSVFNGFCQYHDKKLFEEIEDRPFICTPKQIFLHAYRAVAKEAYLKRRQADSTPTTEDIKKIHDISDESFMPDPRFTLHEFGSEVGASELERFKQKLDTIYMQQDWSRLVTTVIQFSKTPSVICSAPYSPDFDYYGNQLQDFDNIEKDLEHLIVTILPSGNGGFALLSHLDTASAVCNRMIKSILERKDITTSLIWFLFGQFENIAISPDWFESLAHGMKSNLKNHMFSTADTFNMQANRLDLCPEYLDNWQPQNIFRI